MKVLHIGKYYPPIFGGIEQFTYELCSSLTSYGCDVTVLCSNSGKNTVYDTYEGVEVVRAGKMLEIASAPFSPYMYTYLKENSHKFDIIHVQLPNPFATLMLLLANPKCKIIAHWQSDVIRQKKLLYLYHPVLTKFLDRADLLIATSPKYLEGSKYLMKYRHKVEVLQLGMKHLPQPSESLVSKYAERFKGKKILLFIGRLVYYKSVDTLIKSAEFLSDDFHIVIFGKGPLKESLVQEASQTAPDKITFIENLSHEDKFALLSLCHIFILPSSHKSEAFGMVMVEAMQFAKPIICCDIPESGVPWVNMHNESGLVVPVEDPLAVAEAVKKISSSPELYEKLSAGSLKRYKEVFCIDCISDKLVNLYQKTASGL